MLTDIQLKQNIDALVKQGAPRDTVQSYIDTFQKQSDGTYTQKAQNTAPTAPQGNSDLNNLNNPQVNSFIPGKVFGGVPGLNQLEDVGRGFGGEIANLGLGLGQAALKGISFLGSKVGDTNAPLLSRASNTIGDFRQNQINTPLDQTSGGFGQVGRLIGDATTLAGPTKAVSMGQELLGGVLNGSKVLPLLEKTPLVGKALSYGANLAAHVVPEAAAGGVYGAAQSGGDPNAIRNNAIGFGLFSGAFKGGADAFSALRGNLTGAGEKTVNDLIDSTYNKAVKPSVLGIKNSGQIERSAENARTAIKDIAQRIASNPEVSPPTNLKEFSDQIASSKADIWKQVQEKTAGAGGSVGDVGTGGMMNAGKPQFAIKLDNTATALNDVINSRTLQIENPGAVSYARSLQERLSKAGTLSPEETQTLITSLNARTDAFFRNPTADEASHAVIDSALANNLRKELDTTMQTLTGDNTKDLRSLYGAYSSIEKNVTKAALRSSKQNTKILPDFADIFSGADILRGITTLNPADIASGSAIKAITSYYKHLNSPDAQISGMFRKLDSLYSPTSNASPVVGRIFGKPTGSQSAAFGEKLGSNIPEAVNAAKANPKGGFMKVPDFGNNKDELKGIKFLQKTNPSIHPEDIQVMNDFINHVSNQKLNPITDAQYNSAIALADHWGLNQDKGYPGLAKDFRDILSGKKNVTATNLGTYNRDKIGRFASQK